MFNINEFQAKLDQEWKVITNADAAAKAKGTLIGRYIEVSHADSAAYYRVEKVNKKTVVVDHIDFCDGWTIPMIESMGRKIPLNYVLENIEFRDKMTEFFDRK